MASKTVSTQEELDAALADEQVDHIIIDALDDLMNLKVSDDQGKAIDALGASRVDVSGEASITASGNVRIYAGNHASVWAHSYAVVTATDKASVTAHDRVDVRAHDEVTVEARGNALVTAFGWVCVTAKDHALVRANIHAFVAAFDHVKVIADDRARVDAHGQVAVRAYGQAGISAQGCSTVDARGGVTVKAAPHVVVHKHSPDADIAGGVVVDMTAVDLSDAATWCEYNGVQVEDGMALLYKAVDEELTAGQGYGRPTVYAVGSDVECDDWRDDNYCGGGLHLSPHPVIAANYSDAEKRRYLRVAAPLARLHSIGADKCKVPWCTVIAEVDEFASALSD